MILTLKMMGLAFEVHDSHKTAIKRKKDDPDKGDGVVLEDRYRSVTSPSLLNIFHYGFAHSGVLTGNYVFKSRMNLGYLGYILNCIESNKIYGIKQK